MRRKRSLLTGSGLSRRVAQWTQAGIIESIQADTFSFGSAGGSGTKAITAVDTARTILLYLGNTYNVSGSILPGASARIALTNGTTVTGTSVVDAAGATVAISFVAIQFVPGVIKSLQRGTLATATGTATIATVNTLKAWVNMLGFSTTVDDDQTRPKLVLTNATTVTITAGGSTGATASYEVVEFF